MPAYSFLNENTCPCSASPVTFEKLTFWTLGYGGWLGVAMLPILWSIPVSKTVRAALSILMLPLSALTLTAVFACFYVASLFTYHMASVMISPQFLQSCIGIVCIAIASVAFWIGSSTRLDIKIQMERANQEDGEETVGSEEDDDTEEDGEETVGSEEDGEDTEEETVGSEEDEDEDGEETVGSEESDNSHTNSSNDEDATWRDTANFEGLRTAAPLPE